jgi:anti-sigma factor ChrR (cupin superfamily)
MAMTPPPFDDGAVQETDSWLSPGVRVTPVATDGTVAGETETDAVVTLEPTAFSADTRNW